MSSARWFTRVHCRGFHNHSQAAATSENFKINIGHRVRSLRCRALWLDEEKCLKMKAELWLNGCWPHFPYPEKRKKKSLFGAVNEQRPLTTAECVTPHYLLDCVKFRSWGCAQPLTWKSFDDVQSKHLINMAFNAISAKLLTMELCCVFSVSVTW